MLINDSIKKKLRRETPRWIVLSIDLYVSLNTFLFSYLIFRSSEIKIISIKAAFLLLPVVFVAALISFIVTSSHKGIIRHTGMNDLVNGVRANFLLALLLLTFALTAEAFLQSNPPLLRTTTILKFFFVNTVVMAGLRILYKSFYDHYVIGARNIKRALIYGAGDSGIITYKALANDPQSNISIFGYVDDNKAKIGKKVNGVPIYDPNKINSKFIKENHIDEIIISIQNISKPRLREIVDSFTGLPINLKIVPSVSRWLNGELSARQIKNARIEDLLGRPPIQLCNTEIQKEFNGKVILVTGAAGSIGSEIARQLMGYPCKQLILVDQAETPLYQLHQTTRDLCGENCEFIIGDVRDKNRMDAIFKTFQPQIVFHAAAYKHVPLMEDNPYESVNTNVRGTKIVADKAVQYGAEKFVMISTDKAVNPTNVMGATKRIAELYVTHLNGLHNTQFIVTRFGNVLGSNGSVIPLFKQQIENGGPITVTHEDVTRYFMTIPEACQLVLEAGVMGSGGEVFVFDMGDSVKIFDLALKMIYLSGLRYPDDIDIKIVGLRPGEKIYEELLADSETTLPTHHEKIMIAKVCDTPINFEEKIDDLIREDFGQNQQEKNLLLVSKIKDLVPEFISQNSIFSSIDQQNKLKVG